MSLESDGRTDAKTVNIPKRSIRRYVVVCTPSIAFSSEMQNYVEQQCRNKGKRWIYEILDGVRERANIKYEDDDCVLLPDTEVLNSCSTLNWLGIFKDRRLKSIRSLNGSHIPLLKRVYENCVARIQSEIQCDRDNIMVYFHYLPSVYQLHVHFCAPYGQYTTVDVCKIHPMQTVISNLQIDFNYYLKARIVTVVVGNRELTKIFRSTGMGYDIECDGLEGEDSSDCEDTVYWLECDVDTAAETGIVTEDADEFSDTPLSETEELTGPFVQNILSRV